MSAEQKAEEANRALHELWAIPHPPAAAIAGLLAAGADPNYSGDSDPVEDTSFWRLLGRTWAEGLALLLDHGARVDGRCREGR